MTELEALRRKVEELTEENERLREALRPFATTEWEAAVVDAIKAVTKPVTRT